MCVSERFTNNNDVRKNDQLKECEDDNQFLQMSVFEWCPNFEDLVKDRDLFTVRVTYM